MKNVENPVPGGAPCWGIALLRHISFTKQLQLAMKLTAIILLTACLQVSAKPNAQNVTLSEKNAPLEKIFQEIKRQTGYSFLYSSEVLKQAHRVDIDVRDASLAQALNACFAGQPLSWEMEDKTIIVKPKTKIAGKERMPLPPIDVHGRILNDAGEPVEGASIVVKGNNAKGTTSNKEGYFTINVNEGDVIVVSFVGYQSKDVKVTSSLIAGGNLTITLSKASVQLDETVVIAYGTTTKRLSTGNVTSVKAVDIEKQPVNNPLLAMQGRVPGAFITQANGLPGSQVVVRIRGQNTIGVAGSNPLYIVDGVPFDGQPLELQGGGGINGLGATGATNPLILINPADVESMEVLKDADATAIYGSRGANGVILITTKKAKAGKTTVEAGLSISAGKIAHKLDLLNLQQYLALRRKAFANDGVTPTAANAIDLVTWDTTQGTDFQKLLLGNTARTTNASVSVSGGNQNTRFMVRGNYNRETTVLPGNDANNRGTFHFNADHTSTDGRFNAGITFTYSKSVSTIGSIDPTLLAITLPPNFPLYKANGSYNLFYNLSATSQVLNPLASLDNLRKTNSTSMVVNMTLQYQLFRGLKFKTSMGVTTVDFDQKNLTYKASFNTNTASASFVSNTSQTYVVEPMLEFNQKAGPGKLNVIVGGTWQDKLYSQPYNIWASGIPSDNLIENYLSASSVTVTSSGAQYEYKYVSGFGRVNYNVGNKYIFNGTVRRDGSSRFGKDKQFGNFGSVGGAWILSEENFIKKQRIKWLSFAKLRANYGLTGNDQINDYQSLESYTTTAYTYGGTSLYPSRLANANFSWETTKKMEFSLVTGFFDNRLSATATWFRNRSGNMLINYTLSPQAGFNSYQANLDAMVQNKGWEFELNSDNIKSKNLTWTSSFNLTIPKNTLLKYPNLDKTSSANTYVIGESLNILRGYHYTGMTNGLPTVQDVNNSGTYTTGLAVKGNGDYVIMGKTTPDFYGGLGNGLTYKNWSLDVFCTFVKQEALDVRASINMPGLAANVDVKSTEDGFKPTQVSSGTAATAFTRYKASDAMMIDASYIRLKNLSLSYNFDESMLRRVKIHRLKLYVQAQNLFTITSFNGMDPESGALTVPPLKVLMAGIQITL